MAVISVEIPDKIAKKLKPFQVLQYDDLEDIIYEEEKTMVDFWKWVPTSEVLSYLKSK